jgi:hypothetical protein
MKFKLFLLVLLCCGWFYSIGSWNQLSRYDAIRALAENGTVCIDAYLPNPQAGDNTGDWSTYGGHYYSNKAPLPILLGAAVYSPLYHGERLAGMNPTAGTWRNFNFWWINLWCSVLPTALAALFAFKLLRELSFSTNRALFWTLAFTLASPLLPYATMMWGHNLAVFCITAALYHTIRPNARPRDFYLAGLYAGGAVLADYLSAVILPFLALYLFYSRDFKAVLRFGLGGIPALLIHAAYHTACFGNPILPATFYNNPLFTNSEHVGGIFYAIKPIVILELLVGIRRGLLWCAPLAFCAIPAIPALWKRAPRGKLLVICTLGSFLSALMVNAAFNGWHGGAAIGPRYLFIALPPLFLLAAHYQPQRIITKWLLGIIGLTSAGLMFLCAAASPLVGEIFFNPLFSFLPSVLFSPERLAHVLCPGAFIGLQPFSDFAILALAIIAILRWLHWPQLPPKLQLPWREWLQCAKRNWLIIIGTAILLALPSLTQFLFDESALIANALQHNHDGVFATIGLRGTVGQYYGALPTICYQMLLLFTHDPIILVAFKSIIFVALMLWCTLRLRKLCGDTLCYLPLLFLFSPWFWLWSRMLWDNVFQIPLTLLAIVYFIEFLRQCDSDTEDLYLLIRPLGMALLFAIGAVWVHSMSISMLAALPLFLLIVRYQLVKQRWRLIASIGLPALLLFGSFMLPRIMGTINAKRAHTILQSGHSSVQLVLSNSLAFPRLLSNHDIYAELSDMAGHKVPAYMDMPIIPSAMRNTWRCLGYASAVLATILVLAGIVHTLASWRKRLEQPAAQLGLLAIIIVILHVTMLGIMHPVFFIHYLEPLLIPAAILATLGANVLRLLGKPILTGWLTISTAAIILLLAQLALTDGQEYPPFGITLRAQWRAARTVVYLAKQNPQVNIENSTVQYYADRTALGVILRLATETVLPPPPPQHTFNTIRLVNPNPPAGHLKVIAE